MLELQLDPLNKSETRPMVLLSNSEELYERFVLGLTTALHLSRHV